MKTSVAVKHFWFFALLFKMLSAAVYAERQSFDRDWRFSRGDMEHAASETFDDRNWKTIQLPHDWSITGPIAMENPAGSPGGFFPTGVGWYRKTFQTPAHWSAKQVVIHFDGVYMRTEVWLNGQKLGGHLYGFTPFSFDLTSYLRFGQTNTISVRIDNSVQPNCRWYSGSGIYRHVWLDVREPIHFTQFGVGIRTEKINNESANLSIELTADNTGSEAASNIRFQSELFKADSKGQPIGESLGIFKPDLEDFPKVKISASVAKPRLWSVESPELYVAISTLKANDKVVDTRHTVFGIRTIEVSADKGFLLNGKRTVLYGACVHDDNGPLGVAAYDRAEERRVEQLKSAGFNAVRCAHNPPAPAFLDACDRLGLLVIDEIFDTWSLPKTPGDFGLFFNDRWQQELDAMILRDRNHPSIFAWSLGNEILLWGNQTQISAAEGNKLIQRTRELDPTRWTTTAVAGWNLRDGPWEQMNPLLNQFDVVGYNYAIHRYESDHQRFPDRVIIGTESFPRELFETFDRSDRMPHVIGDFVWTGIDYLGESGIGRYHMPDEKIYFHTDPRHYPYHGAYCGDIDLTGLRKPISYFRNITWDRGEKLYTSVTEMTHDGKKMRVASWGIVPSRASWTWPGFEGKKMEVQVYSRYDTVRLYLNNVLIGEKPTNRETQFHTTFDVTYAPGKLETVGIKDEKEIERNTLITAGEVAGIRLSADRTEIHADGQDLSHIIVESVDEQGNFQPNGDQSIEFTIEGPGEIVGVGNADLGSLESYQANSRKLFQGRAIVIIKSSEVAGVIKLSATSEKLNKHELEIQTK